MSFHRFGFFRRKGTLGRDFSTSLTASTFIGFSDRFQRYSAGSDILSGVSTMMCSLSVFITSLSPIFIPNSDRMLFGMVIWYFRVTLTSSLAIA